MYNSEDYVKTRKRTYDLLPQMSPYYDPHMLFPWLRWLKSQEIYEPQSIDKALVSLFDTSTDEDMIRNTYQNLQKAVPSDVEARLATYKETHENIESTVRPFVTCIYTFRSNESDSPERFTYKELTQKRIAQLSEEMKQHDKTPEEIKEAISEEKEFSEESNYQVLAMAKSFFMAGNYSTSTKWLKWVETRVGGILLDGLDSEFRKLLHWGLISSLIMQLSIKMENDKNVDRSEDAENKETDEKMMQQQANEIADRIMRLDELMEELTTRVLFDRRDDVLLSRTWLLHWAIWPLFRYFLLTSAASGTMTRGTTMSDLMDWFLSDKNLQLVISSCPHLLRYHSVCAIFNRKRHDHFKAVTGVISQYGVCRDGLKDPFTSLLEALFVNFDFAQAQHKLAECSLAADADFFLQPLKLTIEENARLMIFETYCRIHRSINIDMIAKQINMSSETAERWIVNLIRHARLEAKIDSERNRVEISNQIPNVYQQIMEKTRTVLSRSTILSQNIDKATKVRVEEKPEFKTRKPVNKKPINEGERDWGNIRFGNEKH